MPFGKIEFLPLFFQNCLIYTTRTVDNLYIARIIFRPYGIILKNAAIHTLRFDEIGFDVISRKVIAWIDSKLKVYRKFALKRTTLIHANTMSGYSHPGKIAQCYVLTEIFENIEYILIWIESLWGHEWFHAMHNEVTWPTRKILTELHCFNFKNNSARSQRIFMEFQCPNLHFVNSDFSKNLTVLSASTSYNIVALNDLMKHAS